MFKGEIKNCEGFFLNKSIKPAYGHLIDVVGKQSYSWDKIFRLLKNDLKLRVNFSFHITIGWILEFNRSGKVVILLIPDKDCFKVIILSLINHCQTIRDINDLNALYKLIHTHVKSLPKSELAGIGRE